MRSVNNLISLKLLLLFCTTVTYVKCDNLGNVSIKSVDLRKTKIWGPGIEPHHNILPVRYFFIQPIDAHGYRFNASLPLNFTIDVRVRTPFDHSKIYAEQIDRRDGSYIIRYKVPDNYIGIEISVQYKEQHVANSPYLIEEPIMCKKPDIYQWFAKNNCSEHFDQIEDDLKAFKSVNFTAIRSKILEKYNLTGSISLCNYIIKDNRIYRKCYGQHTGFKMFSDAILQALVKSVHLPDTEFFMNLGDWPLVKKGGVTRTHGPYPIFSWCGSDDTYDIVLPTYDLTESSLEAMNRVTLDILSVQQPKLKWEEKESKAFWRGRDSRRERLNLVDIARQHPDLFNVSLTNFFFFRDEENKYGPKVPHMSFFDFFNYKYQINIDGTVAAYRFPYLLAGNAVVFKQESPFYEHFYKQLKPMQHFIPIKRDLSDLVDRLQWAQKNDEYVRNISKQAQQFVNVNLLPSDIFCYHMRLLEKWSKNVVSDIEILKDMEELPELAPFIPPSYCHPQTAIKEEL